MRNSYQIIQFLHGKKINFYGSNKDLRGTFENQTYQSINKESFRNKYTVPFKTFSCYYFRIKFFWKKFKLYFSLKNVNIFWVFRIFIWKTVVFQVALPAVLGLYCERPNNLTRCYKRIISWPFKVDDRFLQITFAFGIMW